jgi:hypothetical protein
MWFRKHPSLPEMPDPVKHRDDASLRLAVLTLKAGPPITITRHESGEGVCLGTLPVPSSIVPETLRWIGFFLTHADALAQARQWEDERRAEATREWERKRAAGEPLPEPMSMEKLDALLAEMMRGIDAMPPPKRAWWRR